MNIYFSKCLIKYNKNSGSTICDNAIRFMYVYSYCTHIYKDILYHTCQRFIDRNHNRQYVQLRMWWTYLMAMYTMTLCIYTIALLSRNVTISTIEMCELETTCCRYCIFTFKSFPNIHINIHTHYIIYNI